MSNLLTPEALAVVESGRLAHFTTIAADGGPHTTIVWVGPGAEFPPMPHPPDGFIIRVTPTRVRGMGPWGTQF